MTRADIVTELRRPASLWRESDPNLRRLILAGFIEMLSVNAYYSLIVPFAKTIGLGSQSVGSLSSVLQIVSALVAVGAGVMADRAGRKTMYVAGQIVRVAITIALLTAHSYFGLVIVFVLRGLCMIQVPAQQAMTAGYTRRSNRATMLGLTQTLSQLASVLMPMASGALADRYGPRLSFVLSGVLALVAVVIGLGLKDQPITQSEEARQSGSVHHEPLASRISRLFSGKRGLTLTLLLTAGVFNGVSNGAMNILLPFTIMDRFSSAYTVVASASSVMAFGTMLVLIIGGRMADLGGRRKMVMASGLIFPLIMLPIFFITSLWQLVIILVLTGMVGNIASPAIGATYMEAVEDRDRATFAGLQMSLNAAGMALGSVAAGIGYRFSPNGSWATVIAIMFLQVVCYNFVLPHDNKRAAAAPSESPTAGL